jgi:hypothetical protein
LSQSLQITKKGLEKAKSGGKVTIGTDNAGFLYRFPSPNYQKPGDLAGFPVLFPSLGPVEAILKAPYTENAGVDRAAEVSSFDALILVKNAELHT